ncbi:prolyl oligopeptidase family serine peptidase [Gloeothece verrucosa]|uniref:prolyl oligopeptidase family serine peptidase n=1 Tax=Gloeothece verrucosa TaxID=2546359 RepID=UPI001FE0A665|nr:prolyl oligopeptidase family serine peptidase [Gloeothece verrucosa]
MTGQLLPITSNSTVSNNLVQRPEQSSFLLTSEPIKRSSNAGKVTNATVGWNKNLMVNNVSYDLYIPPNSNSRPNRILPCVLVLPGWNFKRTSWIENSKLVQYADKYGYALILPEMGKTLYESSYYPQTTMKWNPMPGGQFIKLFIEQMQQRHHLLVSGQHNTLLGLSTGGRGVALIALENPGLFVAGASLSGDFSQENMKSDRLMTAVYGAYQQFPERWKGKDNPQARAREWKMPLYLAHGTADKIVPESQSRLFYNAIKQYHQNRVVVVYHPVAGAGHDYRFWDGQLEPVFQFIDQVYQ